MSLVREDAGFKTLGFHSSVATAFPKALPLDLWKFVGAWAADDLSTRTRIACFVGERGTGKSSSQRWLAEYAAQRGWLRRDYPVQLLLGTMINQWAPIDPSPSLFNLIRRAKGGLVVIEDLEAAAQFPHADAIFAAIAEGIRIHSRGTVYCFSVHPSELVHVEKIRSRIGERTAECPEVFQIAFPSLVDAEQLRCAVDCEVSKIRYALAPGAIDAAVEILKVECKQPNFGHHAAVHRLVERAVFELGLRIVARARKGDNTETSRLVAADFESATKRIRNPRSL